MPEFEFTPATLAALAVLIIAAVVAVALIAYLARHWRREPAGAPAEEAPPVRELAPGERAPLSELLEGGRDPEPFLMRFVTDEATGDEAGESIAVHEERLVVKGDEGFAAVPLADVIAVDEDLVIREGVNWEDAKRAGDAWKAAAETPVQYDEEGNPVG